MHDDENLENQNTPGPEEYWTEAQWEKHMLENEKLMDKYQKVWDEDPERKWKDPSDLYMKVHHGLDLGKDMPEPEPEDGETEEETETIDDEIKTAHSSQCRQKNEDDEDGEDNVSDDSIDSFRKIAAYKTAFQIAMKVMDLLKKIKPQNSAETELLEKFSFHSFRIAADIAGGHGLGYDEDVLCGNIVKNQWALGHTEQAFKLLEVLQPQYSNHPEWAVIKEKLQQTQQQLQARIAELRTRVWWDKTES